MTYTQKNKDEKGKKSKECNKIETENDDKNSFNNDYNDSNKKGKALRGSLPKSVPLDFGLAKTFASYFYHQHCYPS